MKTVLKRVLDVGLAQTASSEVFHAAGTIVLDYGQLFVNGVAQSTPRVVAASDNLTISHTSGTTHLETKYSTATVGTDTWTFASTTTFPDLTNDPSYIPYAPTELTRFDNGALADSTTFNPLSVSTVNATTYTVSQLAVGNVEDDQIDHYLEGDTLLVADPFKDVIYRTTATGTVLSSIALDPESHPTSVDYWMGADKHTMTILVACQGQSKVLMLDSLHQPIGSIDVISPTSMYVDRIYNKLYVTEYRNNTVLCVDLMAMTATRIPVGLHPYELHGVGSSVFVACLGDNKLYKLGGTSVVTGTAPWRVLCVGSKVYVACSFSNEVRVYDSATLALTATIKTGNLPFSLTATATKLFVGCFARNTVEVYDTTSLTQLTTTTLTDHVFGAVANATATDIFFSVLGSGLPNRLFLDDYVASRFPIEPATDCLAGNVYESSGVLIGGFVPGFKMPASIPPGFGTLLKNGVEVGTSTTVVPDDVLTVKAVAQSTTADPYEVPLTVGTFTNTFKLYTDLTPTTVSPLRFEPKMDGVAGEEATSNEVMISGLRHDQDTVTTTNGYLTVNGVASGASATVKNGDVVTVTVVAAESGLVTATVALGNQTASYEVWTLSEKTFLQNNPFFEPVEDAQLSTEYSSSTVIKVIPVVQPPPPEIPDPLPEPPEPLPPNTVPFRAIRGRLLVNGVEKTEGTLLDGDVLTVFNTSSNECWSTTSSVVEVDGQHFEFVVRTLADTVPDPVYLREEWDSVPRATYTASFSIMGISPGVELPITVDWGMLYINGREAGMESTVKLDDKVVWALKVDGPFSGNLWYPLTIGETSTRWWFHNMSLKGPIKGVVRDGYLYDQGQWVCSTISHATFASSFKRVRLASRTFASLSTRRRTTHAALAALGSWRRHTPVSRQYSASSATVRAAGRARLSATPPFVTHVARPALVLNTELVYARHAREVKFERTVKGFANPKPRHIALLDMEWVVPNAVPLRLVDMEFVKPAVVSLLRTVNAEWVAVPNSVTTYERGFERYYQTVKTYESGFVKYEAPTDRAFEAVPERYYQAVRTYEREFAKPFVDSYALFGSQPVVRSTHQCLVQSQNWVAEHERDRTFAARAAFAAAPHFVLWSKTVSLPMVGNKVRARTFEAVATTGRSHHATWEAEWASYSTRPYAFAEIQFRGSRFVQRATEYPDDDGMFVNEAVARAVARSKGFVDVEIRNINGRYIYIGDCLTRLGGNRAGWIRGG